MAQVTNISCYLFASLSELGALRGDLIGLCKRLDLKGTILLSPEGINLFVAGAGERVEELVARLRQVPGLEGLTPKVSLSEHQPFSRMLVRIKKEIIAFGVEGINPAEHTSPRVSARELKAWLDEGRPITLLDTRNDYEVKLGTFRGALAAGTDTFRQFPEAVRRLPDELKARTVVTFCTGGIRCEKAAPLLEREGFQNVYQLDGGILKYFEACGGAHYEGECFVFDQRVGVDPALRETDSAQCFVCQAPLTPVEQADPRYQPGMSCPHCHVPPEEQQRLRLLEIEGKLRKAASPLPGSIPYENRRPVTVTGPFDRWRLLDFFSTIFSHRPPIYWEEILTAGHVVDGNGKAVGANHLIRAGERYYRVLPFAAEPPVNASIGVLYEDEALIVLNKPAPLPLHPSGRFNRNTLQHLLRLANSPECPRPAHRLDANTTGVLICTRTRHFARLVQRQFELGQVEKIYLARVVGHPDWNTLTSRVPIDPAPMEAGGRKTDEQTGQAAVTEFRVLSREQDGTTLLEARPRTGRTNQIRVHLWHEGFPVCGDPLYLAGQQTGDRQTLSPDEDPMCLHAWKIKLTHPLAGEVREFVAPVPDWGQAESREAGRGGE